jgi:hypothetical protein
VFANSFSVFDCVVFTLVEFVPVSVILKPQSIILAVDVNVVEIEYSRKKTIIASDNQP